jgi:mRNA interferase MazF
MSDALARCSRGDIWMLNWEPRRGSEQGGHRPGLIIQTDLGNHAPGARTTILVPLTTQGRPFVFYVPITKTKDNGLPADSWANCTQVFTVDKARLEKRLGKATLAQMAKVAEALKATLELG